jgi:N-acetylmuramoyl-L-alanine amidase
MLGCRIIVAAPRTPEYSCLAARFLLTLLLLGATFRACIAGAAPWVAIDVGHTLEAPGATSARGVPEFAFNLALARSLAAALVERGVDARLIGEDGLMPSLGARTVAARGAALFVSIHHDSTQPHLMQSWEVGGVVRPHNDDVAGFSLFVSRRSPHAAAGLACASRVGAALVAGGFQRSLYHAAPIRGEMKPFADRGNGVHYFDNLVVLKTARQPALLVEAGVIVNRAEETRLASPEHVSLQAAALAEGISRCLRPPDRGARTR